MVVNAPKSILNSSVCQATVVSVHLTMLWRGILQSVIFKCILASIVTTLPYSGKNKDGLINAQQAS